MKVQLFIPCFVDQLFPNTGFNMVKVLEKLGCTVTYNENQTCCGQPAYNAGFCDDARAVAGKFITDFRGVDYIVSPSASCAGFVRNYYPSLFENSSSNHSAKEIGNRMMEFTEFLDKVLKKYDVGAELHTTATYHDSCAALRECKIKEAPRKLLSKVKGLQLKEMAESETCCGFGGTFSVKYEDISIAMAEQKVQHVLESGAECIISTDLSCLMQIKGYIQKHELNIETMHIADVLANGW